MFWLLTLPLKLAFGVIFGILLLPFFLLRVAIKLMVALLVLPIVLVFGSIGILFAVIGLCFALLIPLLPLAFVAFCVWALVASTSRRPVPYA